MKPPLPPAARAMVAALTALAVLAAPLRAGAAVDLVAAFAAAQGQDPTFAAALAEADAGAARGRQGNYDDHETSLQAARVANH